MNFSFNKQHTQNLVFIEELLGTTILLKVAKNKVPKIKFFM